MKSALEHAHELWDRYCDFERVYSLSMQRLGGGDASAPETWCTGAADAALSLAAPPLQQMRGGQKRLHRASVATPRQLNGRPCDDPNQSSYRRRHVRPLVNALADERDHPPVLKLSTPDGAATWLISEVDSDDPDRLFGLCDLGQGFPELGYVSLAEISSSGRLGLP